MVGFKSIALLLSLLIFAACVPQTKQTECGANEAFSAALRTCVPVVNGPSSFINIKSFLPTSTLTKYKNDTSPITLSIVIANPYAQTYTVEWERIFNGVPVSISPSSPTSYSFAPSYLAGEVGTHIISVKIKDTSNNYVASHSFEIKINDNPRPIIKTATVTPALYASNYTPASPTQDFKFTVYNNGATMSGAGYRTDWQLYRAGTLIDSETDTFPTGTPAGSLSSSGSNFPVYTFNPAVLGIGAYEIRARVTNTAAEVVDEMTWTATVAHPPFSKITNRDIYDSYLGVVWATDTIAYNGVSYTGSPTYNFIPSTISTPTATNLEQGDYCVTVDSGTGTYSTDSYNVRVSYYLDAATLIYSGVTSALDSQVCLSDAPVGVRNTIVFSNSTTTDEQSHFIVARVVDEAVAAAGGNGEYASSDLNSALLGTYPITWTFNVKPQNKAPTIEIGALTGLTCTGGGTTAKTGCSVVSDTSFTVRANLTNDDFYYPISGPADEAHFDYNISLYEVGNAVPLQTCTKASLGADQDGTDGYSCTLKIDSFNILGPVNTAAKKYNIVAQVTDDGSPISGTDALSNTVTWGFNLGSVTEFNSAPTVSTPPGWISANVDEGDDLLFSAVITDAQHDDFDWYLEYCPDVACTTPQTLTYGTVYKSLVTAPNTPDVATHTLQGSSHLDEDFLLNLTALNCHTKKRDEDCSVNFKLKVIDRPFVAAPSPAAYGSTSPSIIKNINPPVALNPLNSYPVPSALTASTAFAFVGLPITINNTPSSILTDASAVAAEKDYRYQWFSKNNTSVTTWEPIQGATNQNLVWTPSLIRETNTPTDNPISIVLCVEDQPESAILDSEIEPGTSACNTLNPWVVTVRDNIKKAHDLSTAPSSTELATSSAVGQYGTETAIWFEPPSSFNLVTSSATYIAMIGNDQRIHVKKTLVRSLGGGIDTMDPQQIISFNPLPFATVAAIKDLSITGTATELYVAYLASQTGSPSSFYPQIRRIDISSGKSVPNNHSGKFGFDYNGLSFTSLCSTPANCSASTLPGMTRITFASGSLGGSIVLGTPIGALPANGEFTVNLGASYDATTNTICGACSAATMAQDLVALINSSTNYLLAGYSAAWAGGGQVDITGASSGDYYSGTRIADRMGKIFINTVTSRWEVPFINKSLGGSYIDKLSIYHGPISTHLNGTASITEPTSGHGLETMDAAIKLDNYFDGTNIWIAMVSKTTPGAGKLYKVVPATFAATEYPIFTGESLLDVQVASSSSYVYVGVTTSVGSLLKMGVYDLNGVVQDQFELDSAPSPIDLSPNSINYDSASDTNDYFNKSSISNYKIVPYGSEARIFAVSKGTGTTYKLYLAKLKKVLSVWKLSCGDCQTISELEQDVSSFVGLGVAAVRDNPTIAYQLATDGAVADQGRKDVAFVSFGRLETSIALPTPTACDPAVGVFNVEGEAIESTTIFSGVSPNSDAGLFRSPFVKN